MAQRKRLNEQVVVITGASSGIGLATARMAAARGAKVVLAARDEAELQSIVAEITGRGGDAIAVGADVASAADVERIGERAMNSFGGFDTWFNNAGVSDLWRLDGRAARGSAAGVRHELLGRGARMPRPCASSTAAACSSTSAASCRTGPSRCRASTRFEARRQGLYRHAAHRTRTRRVPIAVTLIKPGAIDTPSAAREELHDRGAGAAAAHLRRLVAARGNRPRPAPHSRHHGRRRAAA